MYVAHALLVSALYNAKTIVLESEANMDAILATVLAIRN